MKKITHLIICSLLLVLTSCEKDTEPKNFAPKLTTGEVSDVFRNGATLWGGIEKSENVVVKEYGMLYSTLQSMAEYDKILAENDNTGTFSLQLTDLEAGETYYYCTYASSGFSIAKGEIRSFVTVASKVPVFSNLQITGVDEKSFVVNTSILDEGGSDIAIKGFCWKEAGSDEDEPKMNDESKNLDVADDYLWRVSDLKPGQKYAVRAYAVNGNGLGYGATSYVTTKFTDLPVVSSCTPSDSTSTSVTMSARILANASSVTGKGFCYSLTNKLPTVTDMRKISDVPDTVIYSVIDALESGSTYYIRAYAVNEQGVGYGDVFEYTTLPATDVPTVGRVVISNVTTTTAEAVGSVVSDGGTEVTEKGFCYTNQGTTPTLDNFKIISTTPGDAISATLESLIEGTNYHICAYAINKNGVGYGEVVEFTTVSVVVPTVMTLSASEVTETNALLSGAVIADGNGAIIRKGFCWSAEHALPTMDDMSREGMGSNDHFVLALDQLTQGTQYYFRAYAENEKGISYGNVQWFTTVERIVLPSFDVIRIDNITPTTVEVSSFINIDEGVWIGEKGFCYSKNEIPSADGIKVVSHSAGNNMMATITGLEENCKYYICTYAEFNKGVAYGEVQSFITAKAVFPPTVDATALSNITETTATASSMIVSDGGDPVVSKGFFYSATNATPTSENNDMVVYSTSSGSSITANIADLSENTRYYIRAYAANSLGVSYGPVTEFVTAKTINLPEISDVTVSELTPSSLKVAAIIIHTGNGRVDEKGFCCIKGESIPTINDLCVLDSRGGTGIEAIVSGLTANTTYTVRAFARNEKGVSYSKPITITTKKNDPSSGDATFPDIE